MKIIIKTKNIKLTPALYQYIEEKINSLEKFLRTFEKAKSEVKAWVEVGKETQHHRKGPFFRAECQIRLSGKSIRSVAVKEDLRLAIDEVKDELQRGLKRYKRKGIDKIRKISKMKP